MKPRVVMWMAGLVVLVCAAGLPVGTGAAQEGANLLANGGLESPYYVQGSPTQTAPDGWRLWVDAGAPSSVLEAVPHAERPQIREGKTAWTLRSPGAAFTAAGYQQVSGLTPGDVFEATVYAWVYACADPATRCAISDPPYFRSDASAGAALKIGLDPAGGTDPTAPGVIWSEPSAPYDQWQPLSVSASAQGDSMTVYLYMTQAAGLAINRVYWDQAALVRAAAGDAPASTLPPAETVAPTGVPTATPTDAPSATPMLTATPTESPTLTPTPDQPTATPLPVTRVEGDHLPPLAIADATGAERLAATTSTLCLTVFQDEANYGVRDDGETPLPGAAVTVAPVLGAAEPLTLDYDGMADPLCVDVAGGWYDVRIAPPTGYGLTSPSATRLELANGRTVTLLVGSALGYVPPGPPGTTLDGGPDDSRAGMIAPSAAESAEPDQEDERALLDTLYRTSGIMVLGAAGIFVVISVMLLVLARRGDLKLR